jgi:hypothetical protein
MKFQKMLNQSDLFERHIFVFNVQSAYLLLLSHKKKDGQPYVALARLSSIFRSLQIPKEEILIGSFLIFISIECSV